MCGSMGLHSCVSSNNGTLPICAACIGTAAAAAMLAGGRPCAGQETVPGIDDAAASVDLRLRRLDELLEVLQLVVLLLDQLLLELQMERCRWSNPAFGETPSR